MEDGWDLRTVAVQTEGDEGEEGLNCTKGSVEVEHVRCATVYVLLCTCCSMVLI